MVSLPTDTQNVRVGSARTPLRLLTSDIFLVPLALIVLAIALPQMMGSFGLHMANVGTIMACSAMALTVLVGQAGLLSLGHAAFMAIGAFTAGYLASKFTMDLGVAIIFAGIVGAVFGGITALATSRAVGLYLAVGTLALQYVVELVLTDVEVKVTGANGFMLSNAQFLGFEVRTEPQWLLFTAGTAIATFLLLRWISTSHVGRTWICARENQTIATALGISIPKTRVSAFMLTSFVVAGIGALQGYYSGVVQISNFPLRLSIIYLAIVVLGGPGSLVGAILAAYFMALLPHVLEVGLLKVGLGAGKGAGLEDLTLGVILCLGLLRVPQRAWKWIKRSSDDS